MQRQLTLALPLLFALQLQAQSPTWSDDVACIAFTHCASCHHDGGLAPFSLTNYPDAYWWREEMRAATQVRMMPPWPPDPNYRSLAHERVLTQAEIDIIAAWAAAGLPTATLPLVDAAHLTGPIIDVRQANEYAASHVPGALNIELGQIAQTNVPAGPIAVMCGHGERAMTGASILQSLGYTELVVLAGGPDDWAAATGRALQAGS